DIAGQSAALGPFGRNRTHGVCARKRGKTCCPATVQRIARVAGGNGIPQVCMATEARDFGHGAPGQAPAPVLWPGQHGGFTPPYSRLSSLQKMQLRAEVQTGLQGRGSGEQEGFAALVIFKVNRRRYRMLVVQRWRMQFAFTDECRGGAVAYRNDVSDALHAREVVQRSRT